MCWTQIRRHDDAFINFSLAYTIEFCIDFLWMPMFSRVFFQFSFFQHFFSRFDKCLGSLSLHSFTGKKYMILMSIRSRCISRMIILISIILTMKEPFINKQWYLLGIYISKTYLYCCNILVWTRTLLLTT